MNDKDDEIIFIDEPMGGAWMWSCDVCSSYVTASKYKLVTRIRRWIHIVTKT